MDRAGDDDAKSGTMTDGRLLVVGELNVDLILLAPAHPVFGQHEQLIDATRMTMGSSSAITACGAARLGVPTTLVAVRGDDAFGSYLDAELVARGVDASHLRIDPEVPTGASTHISLPGGDRAILTSTGSIGQTREDDVDDRLLISSRHLHVGSYFLQSALWADAATLFQRARASGVTTSLDGNFDPTERWDRGARGLLAHVDVLFGNDQELCGIAGLGDPDDAVRELIECMPADAVVVHKRGADGARVAWRSPTGVVWASAAVPEVTGELVDTVGAGDSLAAGFLAARLGGASVVEALRLGIACGTLSTRAAGGIDGQPDRVAATSLASRIDVRER